MGRSHGPRLGGLHTRWPAPLGCRILPGPVAPPRTLCQGPTVFRALRPAADAEPVGCRVPRRSDHSRALGAAPLGLDSLGRVLLPVQPDLAAGRILPLRLHARRPAGGPANRRWSLPGPARAPGFAGLRTDHAVGQQATAAGMIPAILAGDPGAGFGQGRHCRPQRRPARHRVRHHRTDARQRRRRRAVLASMPFGAVHPIELGFTARRHDGTGAVSVPSHQHDPSPPGMLLTRSRAIPRLRQLSQARRISNR